MDKKAKNILQYVFWAAVAVVLLWFCFRAVNWNEFIGALKVCKWGHMVTALLCGGLFVLLRSLRWHMLIRPIDPSITWVDVFNAYGIGYVVNLVLPRAGEVVKMGYVVKHSAQDADGKRKFSWDSAIGTFVVERGIDAIVVVLMTLVFLWGMWDTLGAVMAQSLGQGSSALIWGTVVLTLLGIVFLLLCYFLRERGGLWGKIWGFMTGIGKGLGSFRHMERPWLFILYTLLIWGCHWLAGAAVIWSLEDIEPFTSMELSDAFYLMVAGSISTLIPVPGGFGAYHGAVASTLQALHGIPLGSGMIYATLNHESQILGQALTGLWGYIHESFIRRKP